MLRGKFITIEGSEGAGKSTAIKFIYDFLKKSNKDVVFTREPGGTKIAEQIREILLNSTEEAIQPETELLLMFAGRAQHISQCLLPALHAGKCVISDRYIDASYAYQGGGRGINVRQIRMLDQLIVGQLYPDLTILLDVPPEVGLTRAEKREKAKDRIEQEKIEFFMRVRNSYLERAKQDPKRIKVIDASLELPDVQKQIQQILEEFFTGESL